MYNFFTEEGHETQPERAQVPDRRWHPVGKPQRLRGKMLWRGIYPESVLLLSSILMGSAFSEAENGQHITSLFPGSHL